MKVYTADGKLLQLGELLGSGGEGYIYEVQDKHPRGEVVAKIFHDPAKAAEREAKLRYMVQNPPESIEQNGHTFLAWPLELLFDEQGQFTGFLMPKARGVELEYLCSDDFESYPEFQSPEWHKFYFSAPMVAGYRLRTAFNICAAVYAVHAKGYVIGDLKPGNVLLQPNGLVTLIDLDSIQITGPQESYPAAVLTPENAPPESKDMTAEDFKNESWDRFSLAVMLYRFLTGIHPFTGTLKPPYDKLNTYEELIRHGFYPHGSRKDFFEVIPPTHRRLFTLYPTAIAQTFGQAFDTGLFQPDKRPSALEWNRILHEALKAAEAAARKAKAKKKLQVRDNKAFSFTKDHPTDKRPVILSLMIGMLQIAMLIFNKYLPVPFRLVPTPWLLQGVLISLYALIMPVLFTRIKKEYINVHTHMLIAPPLIILQWYGLSFFFDGNGSLPTSVFYYCIILLGTTVIYSYLIAPKKNKYRKKDLAFLVALPFLAYFICTAYGYFCFFIVNSEDAHPEKFLFIEGDFLNEEVFLAFFDHIGAGIMLTILIALIAVTLMIIFVAITVFLGLLDTLKEKMQSLRK
ncbi:MAG: hypothetical protein KatS3mg033_0681 [Thermonema sp.]|uniref:protein kinase domain-containing protein n=1 Tax=Thermonema sp. TaxID=2231181 RepID=UPI0021DE2E92|nr:hypothetical protein [Thermonema sp.]GIV38881.1 MAG: hypothetical protein KatS3mg033_0681 [Thermonema sp.]